MDEQTLFKGIFRHNDGPCQEVEDSMRYSKLPFYNTVSSIKILQNSIKSSEHKIFNTDIETLNKYLKDYFGIDLYDFMIIYTERFINNGVAFPVTTPFVTCVFAKENDLDVLKKHLESYQSPELINIDGSPANFHDKTLYVFSLFETTCNISKAQSQFPGVFERISDATVIIKSSVQFDITVTYKKEQ